jgi:hypothetical protein
MSRRAERNKFSPYFVGKPDLCEYEWLADYSCPSIKIFGLRVFAFPFMEEFIKRVIHGLPA